jgi:hypothetical protein
MARLAREKDAELVLYRIREDASPDAFLKHEHLGGEFYLVLKGKIADETGDYQRGDVVFLPAQSAHTPRAIGETVVLVLWPAGCPHPRLIWFRRRNENFGIHWDRRHGEWDGGKLDQGRKQTGRQ